MEKSVVHASARSRDPSTADRQPLPSVIRQRANRAAHAYGLRMETAERERLIAQAREARAAGATFDDLLRIVGN